MPQFNHLLLIGFVGLVNCDIPFFVSRSLVFCKLRIGCNLFLLSIDASFGCIRVRIRSCIANGVGMLCIGRHFIDRVITISVGKGDIRDGITIQASEVYCGVVTIQ